MVEIEGKRGRKVPVLLTPNIKGAMDILVKTRREANINTNNKFFFASPSEDSLLKHCIKAFSEKNKPLIAQPDSFTILHTLKSNFSY